MIKKLTCHCGGVEGEVKMPENGFNAGASFLCLVKNYLVLIMVQSGVYPITGL